MSDITQSTSPTSTPQPLTFTVTDLVMIDQFLVDIARMENHDVEIDVTQLPVEKGSDLTDNIRPKPLTVTLDCIVSNMPIDPEIIVARDDESFLPANAAYRHLLEIAANRQTVTIRTSLDTFTSMAPTHISIPRSIESADALFFTVSFRQVRIVSNTRTATRVSTPRAVPHKTVNAPPVPATLGNKQVKIIGAVDPAVGGLLNANVFWYDNDINGWRTTVTPYNGSASAEWAYNNPGKPQPQVFVTKGRPFGATFEEWNDPVLQNDKYWANALATRAANNPNLDNPFNPWESATSETGGGPTVRLVTAVLYNSQAGGPPPS